MDRLRAFEIFVRVAEAKSFSRAAEALELGNATVSSCVRNLETYLGVILINRDTRRLSLTEEGLRLLPQAKRLLEDATRIEGDARGFAETLRGPLHVEIPISIGNAVVLPALPAFSSRYPDIEVSLVLSNRPHHMIEQAIDVAIRMEHVEDDDLIARLLFESRYIAVCSTDIARTLPAHPDQLDPRICLGVMPEDRWHPWRWILQRGEQRIDIRPRGPLNLNTSDAVLRAAKAGVGVALVLDVFANASIESGELSRVYPDWQGDTRQFYLVSARSSGGSARVQAFTSFLLQLFDQGKPSDLEAAIPVRGVRN